MIKFNENHIFSNYLKQLLVSFNLPHYNNGNWANDIPTYNYNQKIQNVTRNLRLNSNVYDSYTHEYLGDYLRFHRDYAHINLMPLYNCFSNRLCSKLDIEITTARVKKVIVDGVETTQTETVIISNFNTQDANYKIYMFPVKLNKEYTIAIDSAANVEICCGAYSKYQISKTVDNTSVGTNKVTDADIFDIPSRTYKKYNLLKFTQPQLYTLLNMDTLAAGSSSTKDTRERNEKILKKYEDNLKMFIKLPVENNSSIVVLEGNYVSFNDYSYKQETTTNNGTIKNFVRTQNYSALNGKAINKYTDLTFVTNLQLLRLNTNESYPFADRLIEYLVGNAITNQEQIEDNITRVQTVMRKKGILFDYDGLWEDKIRCYAYNFMQEGKYNTFANNHDILGFIDKEVEQFYSYDPDNDATTDNSISISKVDIYPDIYKDSKVKEKY